MFENLRHAMDREVVDIGEIAATLGVHRNSVHNKMNGTSQWTYDEVLAIQKVHFPHYDLGWLFKKFPRAS